MQDGTATERIWLDFHGRLLSFIRGRVAAQQDAEDILQDVFTRIHLNIRRLSDAQKLTSWIYQITRNAIVDHYRARAKDAGVADRLADTGLQNGQADLGAGDDEGGASGPSAELAGCIEPLLRELPDHYRQAIELTELGGLTQKEAAETVELSLPGMKARVQRGRRKLQELLLDCCHVELDRRGGVVDYVPKDGASCGSCGCGSGETEPS